MRFGEMSVQSMGKMGKDFCPNFLQPLLENVDERRMGRFQLHNGHMDSCFDLFELSSVMTWADVEGVLTRIVF